MSLPIEQAEGSHHSHGTGNNSLLARQPVLTGLAIGVVTLVPHALLPPEASLGFAAVLIALIGGIYFGFAVVSGSARDQFVEFNVAGLFAVAGLLGLLRWPILLPLTYFGHTLWDLAHHNRWKLPLVAIPIWYVPWCAIIDVIIGAGLLIIWKIDGII